MSGSVYKPHFVIDRSQLTIIYLGRQLPAASSSLPEAVNGTSSPSLLLDLAPGGVCLAAPSPDTLVDHLRHRFTLATCYSGNTLLCGTLPSRRRA
jgi:hypothetical protein